MELASLTSQPDREPEEPKLPAPWLTPTSSVHSWLGPVCWHQLFWECPLFLRACLQDLSPEEVSHLSLVIQDSLPRTCAVTVFADL